MARGGRTTTWKHLTVLSLVLLLAAPPALHAGASLRFSFGRGMGARLSRGARCRCWPFVGPGGAARFHHRELGSGYCWSVVDLIRRRGGRWHDVCPRCGQALFLREDRPYCPRCVLRFRMRPCPRCHAPLFVGLMDLHRDYEPPPVHRRLDDHAPDASGRKIYNGLMAEGLAHLQAGRWTEGARSFRRAIRESPEDPVSLLYWALALGVGGEVHRAGRIMRKVAMRFPALASTRLDLDALLGGPERRAVIETRLAETADEENGRFFHAAFLHLGGRTLEARRRFRALAGTLPEASRFVNPGSTRP